jgi:hypothetical protein
VYYTRSDQKGRPVPDGRMGCFFELLCAISFDEMPVPWAGRNEKSEWSAISDTVSLARSGHFGPRVHSDRAVS